MEDYDNSFNSWYDKKDIAWMSEYFPKLKPFGVNVKVELDLSNYAIKVDFKKATGVDTSNLASLKSVTDE